MFKRFSRFPKLSHLTRINSGQPRIIVIFHISQQKSSDFKKIIEVDSPGSEASRLCWDAGGCERGPGVPGDLTSSLTGPPQDNDDDGGLCNQKQYFGINDDILSAEQQEQMLPKDKEINKRDTNFAILFSVNVICSVKSLTINVL